MKVYTTLTPSFAQICSEILEPSVKAVEPGLSLHVENFALEGNGDFLSSDFTAHNVHKNEKIMQWIRENWGGVIFVTDADILYFRPFEEQLLKDLGDRDIAFACKGMDAGFNIGQIVIRCNFQTLSLLQQVNAELAKGVWDEAAINAIVPRFPIKPCNISRLFTDTCSWEGVGQEQRRHAFSYHATETQPKDGLTSVERKNQRFGQVLAERRAAGF